jgi:hypothetical protein
MSAEKMVKDLIGYGAKPSCIRLNVTRETARKFAKPLKRGGPLMFEGVEVIPMRKKGPKPEAPVQQSI